MNEPWDNRSGRLRIQPPFIDARDRWTSGGASTEDWLFLLPYVMSLVCVSWYRITASNFMETHSALLRVYPGESVATSSFPITQTHTNERHYTIWVGLVTHYNNLARVLESRDFSAFRVYFSRGFDPTYDILTRGRWTRLDCSNLVNRQKHHRI